MPFSKWWCNLDIGDIALQYINVCDDLFFIHWHLKEVSVNEEGLLTAVAEHPSAPHSHPRVEVVIDPLTAYLVECQDSTALFTLLGETYVRASFQTVLT